MSHDDFLVQIQKEFLEEATFFLNECEESYLKLEDPAVRPDEINKIFRLAHTLKGAGAAVGFSDLSAFAHKVEDYLTLLKSQPEKVDTHVITLLLNCGDRLKVRIESLKRDMSGSEKWSVGDLEAELIFATQVFHGELKTNSSDQPPPSQATTTTALNSNIEKPNISETQKAEVNPPPTLIQKASEPISEKTKTMPMNKGAEEQTLLKIEVEKVEKVLNIVGELVVLKSQLMDEGALFPGQVRLNSIISQMDKTIRDLQDRSLGMRMTPLKSLFLKTQRVLRDLSLKLSKPIDFEMAGEDQEIDRTMVDMLADPLLHIARNALDHGIEKPEYRKSVGKNEKGRISIRAEKRGDRIEITLQDDGGGLKKEKIFQKALERGLLPTSTTLESLPDEKIFSLIFEAGFSTAEQVTDVSGRGVGMDVVKTNIEKLRGLVRIESEPGKGSSFVISLPLTASITDGMIVEVASNLYIIPTERIVELFESHQKISLSPDSKSLKHRNAIYPCFSLGRHFHGRTASHEIYVLVKIGSQNVALGVSKVVGQTQVVLKSMSEHFDSIKGIGGAAILGNGQVALVVDPDSLKELFLKPTFFSESQAA
jgi:two-component system chemotaxis sensor kinase CheA